MSTFSLSGFETAGAQLEVVHLTHSGHSHRGGFSVALVGYGFEASRYLTREEMVDLRDWATNALTSPSS